MEDIANDSLYILSLYYTGYRFLRPAGEVELVSQLFIQPIRSRQNERHWQELKLTRNGAAKMDTTNTSLYIPSLYYTGYHFPHTSRAVELVTQLYGAAKMNDCQRFIIHSFIVLHRLSLLTTRKSLRIEVDQKRSRQNERLPAIHYTFLHCSTPVIASQTSRAADQ